MPASLAHRKRMLAHLEQQAAGSRLLLEPIPDLSGSFPMKPPRLRPDQIATVLGDQPTRTTMPPLRRLPMVVTDPERTIGLLTVIAQRQRISINDLCDMLIEAKDEVSPALAIRIDAVIASARATPVVD